MDTVTTLKAGHKAFRSIPIEVKGIDKEAHRLTMVASTQSIDRHGDTIMQDGWDLSAFLKNPVILNSHNYSDATEVIARGENARVEGKGKKSKLVMDWVFAVNENPKAKIIWDLYVGKFLSASSVGFIPRKFAENADGTRNWYVIEEAELLEVSAVSVPANATALLAKSIGIDIKELEGAVEVTEEVAEDTTGDEAEQTEETETEETVEEVVAEEPVAEPVAEEVVEETTIPEEVVTETPAPVVTDSYSTKVARAIHNLESREKRAYRKAGAIILSLLNEEQIKVNRATREQIRKRKVNQAIRELLKTK